MDSLTADKVPSQLVMFFLPISTELVIAIEHGSWIIPLDPFMFHFHWFQPGSSINCIALGDSWWKALWDPGMARLACFWWSNALRSRMFERKARTILTAAIKLNHMKFLLVSWWSTSLIGPRTPDESDPPAAPACQAQFYAVNTGTHPTSAVQQGWSTWCALVCSSEVIHGFSTPKSPINRRVLLDHSVVFWPIHVLPWAPLVMMKRSILSLSLSLKLWNLFRRSKMWLGKYDIMQFFYYPSNSHRVDSLQGINMLILWEKTIRSQ